MKQICWILLIAVGAWMLAAGCNDKDEAVITPDGIEFSPATPYQEAAPGTIINFKVKVRTAQPVNRFALRFQLPGSNDFVLLPEYPDLEGEEAAAFNSFGTMEFALPASMDTINTELRIKVQAATAAANYEKEYTIRLKSAGRQQLRLYNPSLTDFVRFDALDLRAGKGIPAGNAALYKDLVATTHQIEVPLTNSSFPVIKGWEGVNGTTFKQVTAANFNDSAHKYVNIYKAINVASELNGLSSMLTVAADKIGVLSTNNQYYIAKVKRDTLEHYIGIMIRKYPPVNTGNSNAVTKPDPLNEYIQLEIKQ